MKVMRIDEFLPQSIKLIRDVLNMPRATFTLSSSLGLTLLLFCSFGCAPPASQGDGKQTGSTSTASNDIPEITEEKIHQEINDVYIREVPEENGAGEPISWRIDEDEPKEFTIVEKQMEGERATIIIDIKTQSARALVRRDIWLGRFAQSGSFKPAGRCANGRLSKPRTFR
jgi:hypothetical protein